MQEILQGALKDAERVVKKQRLCASSTLQDIEKLLEEVEAATTFLNAGGASAQQALAALCQQVQQSDALADMYSQTKELHGAVNKLGKAVEKAFAPDVCEASKDVPLDDETLDQVIAQHFFQQGEFEVGRVFVEEAGISNGDQLMAPYEAMHDVLQHIQQHNLEPALRWTKEHADELASSSGQQQADAFAFKLHRLHFLHILSTQGTPAALQYARLELSKFQSSQMRDIQRLMGCLCFVHRLPTSPYAHYMAPSQWDDMARDFTRQCCGLLGQASESPLLVTVAAGSVAIPTLLKLATLLKDKAPDFGSQLPMEVELGREFIFQSIFACPVSKDQSTAENPPMMLPCGHVLCKGSILKIAKSSTRAFKCPYCPLEATPQSCRQISFPRLT